MLWVTKRMVVPVCRQIRSGSQAQTCVLAASRRAEEAPESTRRNLDADVLERGDGAALAREPNAGSFELDGRRHSRASIITASPRPVGPQPRDALRLALP